MAESRPEPRNVNESALLDYLLKVREVRLSCRKPAEFTYNGFEDYLIQHGTFFAPIPLPSTIRPMMLSQGFENCYRVAARTKAYHYAEGIALGIIPIHHGFLVDKDGNAIDPTWASGKTGLGSAYIGVEFDLAQVRHSRRGGILSLSDDYRRDFPILRGEDVMHKDAWFKR